MTIISASAKQYYFNAYGSFYGGGGGNDILTAPASGSGGLSIYMAAAGTVLNYQLNSRIIICYDTSILGGISPINAKITFKVDYFRNSILDPIQGGLILVGSNIPGITPTSSMYLQANLNLIAMSNFVPMGDLTPGNTIILELNNNGLAAIDPNGATTFCLMLYVDAIDGPTSHSINWVVFGSYEVDLSDISGLDVNRVLLSSGGTGGRRTGTGALRIAKTHYNQTISNE